MRLHILILTTLMTTSGIFSQSDIELSPSGIVLPRISKAQKATLNAVEGQMFYNPESKSIMVHMGNGWGMIKPELVSVSDIDGNSYDVVEIAGTKWTMQNLRTTKLNDGTPIMKIGSSSSREKDELRLKGGGSTPLYTYYNNDSVTHAGTYGALYNHCVVSTGNLCPLGWRVPSENDYLALDAALGGRSVAGGAMKDTTTTHWNSPNNGATNSTGFSALPGGRFANVAGIQYSDKGFVGYYWSSTVLSNNPNIATYRSMSNIDTVLFYEGFSNSTVFLSVRCVL